jgi:hypothetical protein
MRPAGTPQATGAAATGGRSRKSRPAHAVRGGAPVLRLGEFGASLVAGAQTRGGPGLRPKPIPDAGGARAGRWHEVPLRRRSSARSVSPSVMATTVASTRGPAWAAVTPNAARRASQVPKPRSIIHLARDGMARSAFGRAPAAGETFLHRLTLLARCVTYLPGCSSRRPGLLPIGGRERRCQLHARASHEGQGSAPGGS